MLSTIYRFTPPTCTLEIQGKQSPLSRWIERDVLKKLKFKLSFDDPRSPSYQQVLITGNIQDLEQLKILVDDYTQKSLHDYFVPSMKFKSTTNDIKNCQNDKKIPFIKSKGLTKHELFFGGLNHDNSTEATILTTVQLFDLVTALEAYSTKIYSLPELNQKQRKKIVPLWGGIAAVILAGVGITAILLKSSPMQNIVSSPKSRSSDTIAQFDDVVPPNTPPPSSKKTIAPKVKESLSSAERLPPPPAVDAPKPKPNIPNPEDYSLSQVARQSGLEKFDREQKAPKKKAESIVIIPSEQAPQLEKETNLNQEKVLTNSDDSITSINSNTTLKSTYSKPELSQEIKAYFKDKWQPPLNLKQSLEYRLYLNNDGSINRVVPIGKASSLYLSKSNIPVKGETFISPLNKSQKSIIRLLLNPDGGVKVFTE